MTAAIATPDSRTVPLSELARQTDRCRRCELWRQASRSVFGEGAEDAAMMLVGEQPGDREDLAAIVTIHPPWLLRMPDPDAKARERTRFVTDLRVALDVARSAR